MRRAALVVSLLVLAAGSAGCAQLVLGTSADTVVKALATDDATAIFVARQPIYGSATLIRTKGCETEIRVEPDGQVRIGGGLR